MGTSSSINVVKHHSDRHCAILDDYGEVYFNSIASLSACKHGRFDIVSHLLTNNKIRPTVAYEAVYRDESCVRYPLIEACENNHVEIVKLLLDNNVDVNVQVDKGTALYVACAKGYYKIVELLLKKGAAMNNSNKILSLVKTNVMASYAFIDLFNIQVRNSLSLEYMIPWTSKELLDNDCLLAACRNSNLEVMKLLLKHGAVGKSEHLNVACKNLSAEIVKLLLDSGVIVSDETLASIATAEKNGINNKITKLILGYKSGEYEQKSYTVFDDIDAVI